MPVGPFRFWPFRKLAAKKVADHDVRDHLEKVFATYVRPEPMPQEKGKTIPVTDVTVVTSPDYGFSTSVNSALLNHAVNALTFACIDAATNWNWCTSDSFELLQVRFSPGDPNVGYRAGEIVEVKSLGWELGEVFFQTPIYVNSHYSAKCDSLLLDALSLAVSHSDETDALEILRALQYFAQACKNSGDIRADMRVVLMALSFEVLLDLCDRNPRQDFRRKIGLLCGDSSERTEPCPIIDDRDGHPIATEQLTQKQIWAEEFWKLRNGIVHGRLLDNSSFLFRGQSHFRIAELFFRICVRKKLEAIPGSEYECTEAVSLSDEGQFEFDIWAVR